MKERRVVMGKMKRKRYKSGEEEERYEKEEKSDGEE